MVRDYFRDHDLATIIDIGPGSGTYFKLFDGAHNAYWVGVEIWAPYIEQFSLRRLYHHVVVADARYLHWEALPRPDLIILGDVLEHMPYEDAVLLLDRAVSLSKFVVVSLPIIDYPQGAHEGNEYETHVTTWSKESVWLTLLDNYRVVKYYEGEVTGTYIIESENDNRKEDHAF